MLIVCTVTPITMNVQIMKIMIKARLPQALIVIPVASVRVTYKSYSNIIVLAVTLEIFNDKANHENKLKE